MRTHLTDVCDHDSKAWCVHCEEGCRSCGTLDHDGDEGYCAECQFDRDIMAAEAMAEGMER